MTAPVCWLTSSLHPTARPLLLVPFLLLFLLAVPMERCHAQECTFPDFLQFSRAGSWFHMVRNQGIFGPRQDMMIVTFKAGLMRSELMIDFNSFPLQVVHTQRCLNTTLGGAYVVVREEAGVKNASYLCVQFNQKSSSVVLLRISTVEMDLKAVSCADLVSEHWPMVAKESSSMGERISTSKITDYIGGYDLNVDGKLRKQWLQKCDSTLKMDLPSVEIACSLQNEINLDFHRTQCIPPGLLMDAMQDLNVLAVWQQYNFTFLVLRNNHRNLWCVRLAKSNETEDVIDLVIFLDLVCDPTTNFTEGMNQISFTMIQHAAPNRSLDLVEGALDKDFRGLWYQMDGVLTVNITNSTVHFPNMGKYEFSGEGRVMPNDLVRVPLHSISHNGCSLKALCLEIGFQTRSVIKYRYRRVSSLDLATSQPGDLRDLHDLHDKHCTDGDFSEEGGSPNPFTYIIRNSKNLAVNDSTECTLFIPNQVYRLSMMKKKKGGNCDLEITSSNSSTLTVISMSPSCENINMGSQHCLASFQTRRGSRILLTVSHRAKASFNCWISNTKNNIFYLPRTDCNEDTVYLMEKSGKRPVSMQSFMVNAVPQVRSSTDVTSTTAVTRAVTTEYKHDTTTKPVDLQNYTIIYTFGVASQCAPSIWLLCLVKILCLFKYVLYR